MADTDESDHPDDEGIRLELLARQRVARRLRLYGRISLTIDYQNGRATWRELEFNDRKTFDKPSKAAVG